MIGQVVSKKTLVVRSLIGHVQRGFKGFDQNRWHDSSEVFPDKPFKYGFNKEQVHKTKQNREWYEAPIGSLTKRRFKTIAFREYQAQLEEAAQRTLEGQKIEDEVVEVVVEKDEIFGVKDVPKRYYDRVLQKELYFHHRGSTKYLEYADRKIAFLHHFKPSFDNIPELAETLQAIHRIASTSSGRAGIDQQFIIEDDFYSQNDECRQLFEQIRSKVGNMNYRLLPELGLALSFKLRYNKDVFGIWKEIEQSFMHSIHHYPVMELVKMRYASCGLFPKSLSRPCLKALQDIVFSELHNIPSLLDLVHTLYAFRHTGSLLTYNLLLDEICKRPVKTLPDAIALLFVFSHSLFPNYKRKQMREKDQDLKEKFRIIDHLTEALVSNAKQIQGDDIARVLIGLNNLQTDLFKDVLHHLERNVIKQIDQLDAFQVAQAIYGFSKANIGQGFGSQQLYTALRQAAQKHWSHFQNIDKARTFYAFTSNDNMDPVFRKKLIQPWLTETLESQLTHADLHYVAFSLLFEECKDAELWKKLVRNVCLSQYVVPVVNYYPLKLARYYLETIFPKWNFTVYKLACQEAEATWNASRQIDSIMEGSKEWKSIGILLQNRLEFNSIGLDNFENLFLIDWAIMPQRVAIMIQGERQTLHSGKSTPLHRLKLRLLESKKFSILNLVYKDFECIPADQKIPYLKKKIEELIVKQTTYINDVEEPKEWLKFMDKLQEISMRNILIGEATKGGGEMEQDEFEINFDWSKLQKEFKERGSA